MFERLAPGPEPERAELTSCGRYAHTEIGQIARRRHDAQPRRAVHPLLAMQRSAGNAAVASMLAGRRPAARPVEKPAAILQAPPFVVGGPVSELGPDHVVPSDVASVGGTDATLPRGVDPDEPGLGSIDGPDPLDTLEPVDRARGDHHDAVLTPALESPADGGDRAVVQRLSLSDLPGQRWCAARSTPWGILPGRLSTRRRARSPR